MSNKIQLFIKKVKGIVKLADLNPYQRGKIITALNRNKEQLKLKQAQRTKKTGSAVSTCKKTNRSENKL